MKKKLISVNGAPYMVGVFDSYRDLLEYNKERRTLCSEYTRNLVEEYYTERGLQTAARNNKGNRLRQWLGTTNWPEALEDIWTFINLKSLNKALAQFADNTSNVTTVGFSQRKKIFLNNLYKGVFSFDLAAPYLYPKKEFYSPYFGQEVSWQQVDSEGVEPLLKYYYNGEPRHELEQRDVYDKEGNPVLTSTYDRAKCYIDLPKPKKEGFTVDLFVISTYNYPVNADDLVWNALAINAIAKTIYDAGIQVRIWSITPISIKEGYNMALITRLKDYDEALDDNSVAVVAADPRFYRVHSFRCRSYLADDLGEPRAMDSGMGRSFPDEKRAKEVMLKTFEELEIYDDPGTQKIYPDNKIFVRQCLSEQAGIDEYNRVIKYFEMYSDYQGLGAGTDIETFDRWWTNFFKTGSDVSYDAYLESRGIKRKAA